MINGLQGIPGSGKSYEASVFQVLEALKQGRKVITNLPLVLVAYSAIDPAYGPLIELRYAPAPIRGVWNPEAVDPETGRGEAFKLFDDGHLQPAPEGSRTFGTVWCYWTDWKHPKTGRGPLFVVDECHVAMPRLGTDKSVIEWYKLHRHFNGCDVLLATQNFRQMSQDIAELMAMVIKVRKADVLGRADEYIRKVHAGYRGAEIQQSIRKYEPHFFTLYRSHTQGSAVLESGASDVAPLSTKVKRWTRAMWGVSALAVAFAVWFNASGSKSKKKAAPLPEFATTTKSAEPFFPCVPGAALTASGECVAMPGSPVGEESTPIEAPTTPASPQVEVAPEPYASKTLHLTGRMSMGGKEIATFVVSSGGSRIVDITSAELVRVGYRWEPLTDCMGYLRWGSTVKAVTCDAPRLAAGTNDKPVVLYNTPNGNEPRSSGSGASATAGAPGLVSM